MTQGVVAPTPRGWFVVWTESRAEKSVASRLGGRGVDVWLPSVTERHRWSDRWREVVVPLFPGYLFARGDSGVSHQLPQIPGVLTLVKQAGQPVVLPDDFVASLRRIIETHGVGAERVDSAPKYRVGQEVVVQDGPFAGARGVVRENRGRRTLLVWVPEIGRGVAITIGTARVHCRFDSHREAQDDSRHFAAGAGDRETKEALPRAVALGAPAGAR